MGHTMVCIVCGKEYEWPGSCRCNPAKSDAMMASEGQLHGFETGKTDADKLADGFLMMNLIEENEND